MTRLEDLLKSKRKVKGRKMGNQKKVWRKSDLKKATIEVD